MSIKVIASIVMKAINMAAHYKLHVLDFIASITVEGFRWEIYLAVVDVFE